MGAENSPTNSSGSLRDELNLPTRTHVMPLGFEKERVYRAAIELNADLVVIVAHDRDDLENSEYYQIVKENLDEHGIPSEVERCDLFDLYDSLSVIGEQISSYEKEEVFVNVATGSKVTAIAGMIACMAFDATPYYVKGIGYEDSKAPEAEGYIQLPKYNIEAPEAEQIRMMEYIQQRLDDGEAPTKVELIREAERQQLPFISQQDVKEKGKYRLLDRSIIEPLMKSGYLEERKSGRNKKVTLTEDGQDAVRAFTSLV